MAMLLCTHHASLLLDSLAPLLSRGCGNGSLQAALAYSSAGGDGSSSSSSSESDALSEFHQKVAVLQDQQQAPDLSSWLSAEASSSSSAGASTAGTTTSSSSSSSSGGGGDDAAGQLVSGKYGYAVLGGVNPEASQLEAGAQQPKLHPTRDFRHGDLYDPQDLSPLIREEAEPWLPRGRRGRRAARPPLSAVAGDLDFKDVDTLAAFVSESGRLKPRRETGLKPVLQAKVARTIKLARQMALLPYDMRVGNGGEGDRWRRMRAYEAAQEEARKSL